MFLYYDGCNRKERMFANECSHRVSGGKKMRRRKQKGVSLAVLLCFAVLIAFSVSFAMTRTAEAGTSESSRYKYYTSIQVEPGTSLWEIAREYASHEYEDLDAYIREVRQINHLDQDTIYAGSYLCIPYYSSEYK